jgi:hypothetical protein
MGVEGSGAVSGSEKTMEKSDVKESIGVLEVIVVNERFHWMFLLGS